MLDFDNLPPNTIVYEAVLNTMSHPLDFSVEVKKYKFVRAEALDYIFHKLYKSNWPEFYCDKLTRTNQLMNFRLTEQEAKDTLRNQFERAYYSSLVREFFPVKNG